MTRAQDGTLPVPAASDGTGGPWLLVSDIDDTLTGDAESLARFCAVIARHRARIRVALNSSRPAASVDATIAREFPPGFRPDAIITAMGTQIRIGGRELPEWRARFSGWPRAAIVETVAELGHRAHDPAFQAPAKASFAVPAGEPLETLRARLRDAGLACKLIHSGRDDLDILPPDADKGAAAQFLAEKLGISADRLVAAGDSANDLAMFDVAARSIAVGNARAELLTAMPAARSYRARACHAAGVLEGLTHWGIVPADM